MDYEESLMIKAAWYYYFEEMTQQHVAELMGITRMRVIKLLEKARQTGIIQFRLRKDGESRMQLERNLMSAFGLQDAFVIPAAIDRSAVNAGVAEAASMYISERLTENSLINIGYGDTPAAFSTTSPPWPSSRSPAYRSPAGSATICPTPAATYSMPSCT